MSNAVSRGHGRGKPNAGFFTDHNVNQMSNQFVMPVVPGSMNYQMPPNQMQQAPYSYPGPQYAQQNNYYQAQQNAHHPQHQPQQQQYGGYRPEYGQQMYNQQFGYGQYHSDTVQFTAPQNQQQPQQPAQPPQPKVERKRNVLLIVDPTTNKAIDVAPLQTPATAPPAATVAPVAPEEAEKKEHINRDFLEQVKKGLSEPQAKAAPAPVAPVQAAAPEQAAAPAPAAAAAPAPTPSLPNFSVPPPALGQSQPASAAAPAVPKTPEAPAKVEAATAQTEVTPVSSPQVSDTSSTTPTMGTAESASAGADVRVTPTLQKEDSKEETEDDKFDDTEREETPDLAEAPAEKTPEELAAEKAQKEEEEKEKKRIQEEVLEKKVEQLVSAGEADVSEGTYTRDFMVTIREIERLFSRTPCPLTPHQLSDFGLDIKTMRVADKKPNFTPKWANQSRPNNNPYRGRTTTDGTGRGVQNRDRGNHKRPPTVRASIERVQRITLASSKDAWKPERQKGSENLPEEEAAIKECCKKVRSLMNKVTPTSQKPLTEEFISFNVSSNDTQLTQVVEIMFDKAVEEPKFCALYAEMCKAQAGHELTKHNGKSAFRNKVLTRTQKTFQDKKDIDEDKLELIEKEEDPAKKELMLIEERQKFRRRKFGVMTFIGHLFRNQLLSTKIVINCAFELFASILPKKVDDKEVELKKEDVDEESVHCGLQLIETVGPLLDSGKEKVTGAAFLDQWSMKLEAAKPVCSNKIRFMIMNLIELRKDKWVPRKSTESGPKKIDEIHKDIRQEKIDNEKARDQYDRERDRHGGRHGGGIRTSSNSLKKTGPVQRNSIERNRPQHPEQKRAAAAAHTKLASSNVTPKNISISSMDDTSFGTKKKGWHSGASGGGNTSESAAPAKSAWVRRDSNDQRKKTDERQAVVAAVKEISAQGISSRRSTSQNSLADQSEKEPTEEQKEAWPKIMNTITSDLRELVSGDLQQEEMIKTFSEFVGKEKYGSPSLVVVYEMAIRAVCEKNHSEEERKKLALVLRLSLAEKEQKQAFIDGVTQFFKYVVEVEMYSDYPKLWNNTAEVLMNAVHIPLDVARENKVELLSMTDLAPAFLAAKTEGKKKFDLFVNVLKHHTEAEIAETGNIEGTTWELHELQIREEMERDGLRAEMDAVELSNKAKLSSLLGN